MTPRPTHAHSSLWRKLSRNVAYHPDFGGVRHPAVLFKHPLVVGQQQFEAEPEGEDEGEPQQSAEDQRWHHSLTLGTEGHVEAAQREWDRFSDARQ